MLTQIYVAMVNIVSGDVLVAWWHKAITWTTVEW